MANPMLEPMVPGNRFDDRVHKAERLGPSLRRAEGPGVVWILVAGILRLPVVAGLAPVVGDHGTNRR